MNRDVGINKEKYVGVNVGESWQKLRSVANGEANLQMAIGL